MPTIIVPLDDILTDADKPVDLSTLSRDQAVEHIKDIYGFLGSAVKVDIDDGMATITVGDKADPNVDAGIPLHDAYQQALQMYEMGM